MKKELKFFLIGAASTIVGIIVIPLVIYGVLWLFDGDKGNSDEGTYREQTKIVCDKFSDAVSFLSDPYNIAFIDKENDLYYVNVNKKYSNEQNCKKINGDIKVKYAYGTIILSEDNKQYFSSENGLSENKFEIIDNVFKLYEREDVVKVIRSSRNNVSYDILKNDGKIYSFISDKEEIYKSIDGEKILDFSNYYIKTDKAIYTY